MVKLICYNIEYCEGFNGYWYDFLKFWRFFTVPKNIDKNIVGEIKKIKPEILALVEVDTGSVRAKKNQGRYFKNKLNMNGLAQKSKYPVDSVTHKMPIIGKQGNALMSKYKLYDKKYHWLSEGQKKLLIQASVKCPQKVTLLLAHLALIGKTRAKQIDEIIGIVNKIKNPVILMGDFNTFRGNQEIRKLLKNTKLKDAAKLKHGSYKTHPSIHPFRRLDYVLVSDKIKVKKYEVLKFQFSDHLPLYVEFSVK